ncbi:MAG: GIY-YIG nuclease family protein [Deltaproteobacteria bacterium]|nr:GIY-YIG nuclease family protein [Deltaproteobacteria bacterium]
MQIWVYILQSEATNRYYCGQTSNLGRRVTQHNDPAYHLSKTTKYFEGPWKLVWFQECSDRIEATRLERRIKQRGMGRFLNKLNRQSPADGGINH